jgi:hypothetical protein
MLQSNAPLFKNNEICKVTPPRRSNFPENTGRKQAGFVLQCGRAL